jgi:hypothetical protein
MKITHILHVATPRDWLKKNYKAEKDIWLAVDTLIDGARKRPEEFQNRLRYFIEMTEKNKMFGFGRVERHF